MTKPEPASAPLPVRTRQAYRRALHDALTRALALSEKIKAKEEAARDHIEEAMRLSREEDEPGIGALAEMKNFLMPRCNWANAPPKSSAPC